MGLLEFRPSYGEVLTLDPQYRSSLISVFAGSFVLGFIVGAQLKHLSLWAVLSFPVFFLYSFRVPHWLVESGTRGYWTLLAPLPFFPIVLSYLWIYGQLEMEKKAGQPDIREDQCTDNPVLANSDSEAMSFLNQAPSNLTERAN